MTKQSRNEGGGQFASVDVASTSQRSDHVASSIRACAGARPRRLAGVNDIRGESEGQGPDFVKAFGDRDGSRAAVLLAHQRSSSATLRHGVDLQLSGHTHGGQLWPGNLIAELANRTLAGLERYGDTQLYLPVTAATSGEVAR